MVSFTSFLFGLTVSISFYSFAFSHQDMEETQVLIAAANTFTLAERNPVSISKEIADTRGHARTEVTGGRKMMKKEMFKEQDMDIVETDMSSTIFVATSDNRNILKRSKLQSTNSINLMSETSRSIKNAGHHRRMKASMADSVSLNADYKAPKSHPPKNN